MIVRTLRLRRLFAIGLGCIMTILPAPAQSPRAQEGRDSVLATVAGPDTATRTRVPSMLHQEIIDAFNEFGVQITSPHYIADPPRPFVVPPERWYAAPAQAPVTSAADGVGSTS